MNQGGRLAAAFRGKAVHEATAKAIRRKPITRNYVYNRRGPDFTHPRLGSIELTTRRAVPAHTRKGPAYVNSRYALYM